MLLSAALALYLSRPNLAKNTRSSYRFQIEAFIKWKGDLDIHEISQASLMTYIAFKQEQGRTPRTLNLITTVFKTIFGWLEANRYLAKSPAARLDRIREEPIPDEVRAISMNEWERLRTYAKRVSARDYAILAFLMDTACRVSALVSLRIDKLDLVRMCAEVYEAKIQRWVEVAFSKATKRALEAWLRLRPAVGHRYVFSGEDMPHEPISEDGVRKMMRRMSRKLGMRCVTPHMLRHAALQYLARQPDVTLLDVQTKANHLSARTTLNNYFPQKSKRVVELSQKYSLVDSEESPSEVPLLRVLPKASKESSIL